MFYFNSFLQYSICEQARPWNDFLSQIFEGCVVCDQNLSLGCFPSPQARRAQLAHFTTAHTLYHSSHITPQGLFK